MRGSYTQRALVVILPSLLLFAHSTMAQQRMNSGARKPTAGSSASEEQIIRVRKFEGRGSRAMIQAPEYEARTSVTRSVKPPSEWGMITLTYDSSPDWIDDLTVQFHALALTSEKGQRKYSLYTLTVRYGDIEKGRNHVATAFLRPQALKRFGELVAVAVEVTHDGKIIATESDEGTKLPEQWWKNEAVTGSKDVTIRSGYLLDRSKSPFALINIVDQEVIR